MDLQLSTPALLFPAISLLLLAYTNRFLHLAALIRTLHTEAIAGRDPLAAPQISNLRERLSLIRHMQTFGIAALLGCTLSMASLYFGWSHTAGYLFGGSVLLMAASLALSLREVMISGGALAILLGEIEQGNGRNRPS